MTKENKIIVVAVSIIAAILLLFWFFGSIWLTNSTDMFLRKELGKLNTVYVDYGSMRISIGQRALYMKDVTFCTSPDNELAPDSAGMSVHVDKVAVRGFSLLKMLNRKEIDISSIALTHPEILLQAPLKMHEQIEDSVRYDSLPDGSARLRNIVVRTVKIRNGRFEMRNVTDRTQFSLDSLDLTAYGIGYHFGDSTETPQGEVLMGNMLYNDSLYAVSLKNLSFLSPDGLMCVEVNSFCTENAGPLNVQGIHAYNTCKKGELADKKGKIQVEWIDMSLAELTTTPVCLLRQLAERNFHIDTVNVRGDVLHMMKDVRYPPQKPYPMPQDELLKMDFPVYVGCMHMTAPAMNVEVVTTHLQNCGAMEMRRVDIQATNITNKPGETMKSVVHSQFGHGGESKILLNMKMDKAAHFDFQADMKGLKGSTFNKFLHPLFGAEIACNIHSINTAYAGNRDSVSGTFCMQYDSMRVEVFKEDAPYEMIAKNAGVINFFAPMIVPKSNPRNAKSEPITYHVHATRDPQHNFPVYLIAPMMDGLMQTLLPGFVVKMMAKKQQKKQPK